jgi:hypothetical protein
MNYALNISLIRLKDNFDSSAVKLMPSRVFHQRDDLRRIPRAVRRKHYSREQLKFTAAN